MNAPGAAHATALWQLEHRMREQLSLEGELSDIESHVTIVETAFNVRFTERQIRDIALVVTTPKFRIESDADYLYVYGHPRSDNG